MKFLTDMHTHSLFSCDGVDSLLDMLEGAGMRRIAFYGVSEHFDYDLLVLPNWKEVRRQIDEESYFHDARHLQEDYQGYMNVAIGCECGFSTDDAQKKKYQDMIEKYKPDFIINSVHSIGGHDYYDGGGACYEERDGKMVLRDKVEVYKEYLQNVLLSLDVPYPYDIVGHIGYATRYSRWGDVSLSAPEYQADLDAVLKAIIKKGKILEVNTACKGLCLPELPIVKRYYALGGRLISYGSDAHSVDRIGDKREQVMQALKEIGFTLLTVPYRGEYIQVEI